MGIFNYKDPVTGEWSSIPAIIGPKGPKGDAGAAGKDGISITHSWNGTTLSVTSASGTSYSDLKGEKGDTGGVGPQGPSGNDGYTPIRGIDFWTNDDLAAIDADIAVELAKRGQLKPEFADSTDECTDVTKLYVLPDGYVYAYMVGSGATYTNIISSLPGPDLSGPFNDLGYMDDSYVSTTAPYYNSDTETVMTGLIRFGSGNLPVIYIKGLTFDSAKSHTRFGLFDASGVCTQTINFASWADYISVETLDDTYYKLTPMHTFDTAVYIAFSGVAETGADMVITLDEPIEEISGHAWRSTGHAFIPADYEDRIVKLERDISGLTDRVSDVDGVPAYVHEESIRVIQEFLPKISKRSLNFIALADFHEPGTGEVTSLAAQIRESNTHACQAANYISDSLRLDLLVTFGDKLWGDKSTTIIQGREAAARINRQLGDGWVDVPGNHDTMTYSYEQNGTYFQPGEMKVLYGEYGYRDFEDKKCRVIMLNTMDYDNAEISTNTGVERVSGEQLQWFAETLDMSSKDDATSWRIIIMSHHPLDYMTDMPLANCLQAYLSGGIYSVTHNGIEVNYDFSGKNSAQVLYQFHGHLHNFKVDNIHYLNNGVAIPSTIKRVCIPNACFYRSNEYGENGVSELYGIEFGEETTYAKTAGTAEDTAFCLITVDLDTGKTHAIHYGAGCDREIDR